MAWRGGPVGGINIVINATAEEYIKELQKAREATAEFAKYVASRLKDATREMNIFTKNAQRLADNIQKTFAKSREGPTSQAGKKNLINEISRIQNNATQQQLRNEQQLNRAQVERYNRTRQMARDAGKEFLGGTRAHPGGIPPVGPPRLTISDDQRRQAEEALTFKGDQLRGLQMMGEAIDQYLSQPIVNFARESVAAFELFDQKMTESTSIMEATGAQVAALRENAIQLSMHAPQSAATLAEGYYHLASAGYSAAESLKLLAPIQKFATAGAFDLAEAVTYASDAHRALGMADKDLEKNTANLIRVTDVLVKANSLVNANVRQLSIALTTQAAASLRTFGKGVEEGVAVLAAFAKQGVKAHVAGTTLSRVLRLLNQSALKHADAHARLNFHVFDSAGNMRNLADIIENLERILKPMSDEMKATTLAALGFEARIQQAVLPLIGMSGEIRNYQQELTAAGGATQKVSDKQMQSFHNQLQMVGNQVTSLKIKLGEVLAPAVLFFAKIFGDMSTALREAHPILQGVILIFAGILAVVGPLIVGLTALTFSWRFFVAQLPAGTLQLTLANAAATAFKWTLIGLGAVAGVVALNHIINLATGQAKLNEEMERGVKLAQESRDLFATRVQKDIFGMSSQADPAKRKGDLEKFRKGLENEAAGLLRRRDAARAAINEEHKGNGQTLRDNAELQAEVDDLTKRYENLKEMIKLIGEELKKVPPVPEVLKKQIPDIIKDLEEKRDLFGLKGGALDVAKAKREGKLPPEFEGQANALVKELERMEAAKELAEDLEKTTFELKKQAETFGMTSEEAKVYELRMKGVKEAQLKELQDLAQVVKKKEEHKKRMEEAKKLMEDSRTPLQKFNDKLADLNKMFGEGLITKPVFLQAVEKAKQDFDEAGKSASKAKEEILKLDAVLFGGTESIARIEAFRSQFSAAARMGANAPNASMGKLTLPQALEAPQPDQMGVRRAPAATEAADRAQTNALLREAVRILGQMNKKPEARVRAAGL